MVTISLRAFQKDDRDLVARITETTMRGYVEETFGAWVEETHCKAIDQMTSEDCQIIQIDGEDVGVLVVERHKSHIQLDTLYLLPEAQSKGIGTTLLRELQAEARLKNVPLRLRVLKCNPARLWYEREGFTTVDTTSERCFLEYNP